MTQTDIMAMIAQLLAGREAELLLSGDAGAGAKRKRLSADALSSLSSGCWGSIRLAGPS
jgi:hypothetical protein